MKEKVNKNIKSNFKLIKGEFQIFKIKEIML